VRTREREIEKKKERKRERVARVKQVNAVVGPSTWNISRLRA
jgi:hypothetical protein